MSTEAVGWAIERAPVPAHLFAVLACLAWKADERGKGAYPSEVTLSEWTGKSDRAVRNDLRALEAAGLIRPGDQSLVGHIRADRRPAVYDLAVTPEADGGARPEAGFRPEVHDRSSASGRKYTTGSPVRRDRKPASANKSLIEEPSKTSSSRKREEYDDPAFAEFWEAYPRKIGKRPAWKAWLAETGRGADPAKITKAALRYAEHRDGQDVKFTPHPATWLNQARYDDEAAPARPAERDDDSWMR